MPPEIGFEVQSTDRSVPILELAKAVADCGFTSIFLNEHTHIPVSHPRSQYPPGGPLPERYARFWDPYIALSFIAATTDLQVGTAISQIGEHDPIVLAKAIATLDTLSGGRFTLGVGIGWLREEFEDHGFPASVRVRVVEEKLAVMKALWTQEEAEFDGEFVRLSRSWAWPKPVQKPHPTILLGGRASPRLFSRIVSLADGWIPMSAQLFDASFEADIDELRARWVDGGRPSSALHVTVACPTFSAQTFLAGMERAADLGLNRILLHVFDAPADVVYPLLDELRPALAHS
jgi:probable F420-dependent oxidoreductase